MQPRTVGDGNEFLITITGGAHTTSSTTSDPACKIGEENFSNFFVIAIAKKPNDWAVGNLLVAVAQVGRETVNNTHLDAPILIFLTPAGTGE